MIRGDRRTKLRITPDRRKRTRTPGKFNQACNIGFEAARKLEEQNALRRIETTLSRQS